MQSKPQQHPLEEAYRAAVDRDGWRPGRYGEEQLAQGLLDARIAGPVTSHDRRNVISKIERLVHGEQESQFGITGLAGPSTAEVLALMAEETGFDPDPGVFDGPSSIDPHRVLRSLRQAGRRLAAAAVRGERVVLATGHPAGLILLYMAVADLLDERGAKILRPAQGLEWKEHGRSRRIRYFRGVAVLTDRGSTLHTHDPYAMERMLEESRPDLVFADHGFAGAAIEAGITTLSIADVNDPALPLAQARGRTDGVLVIDDGLDASLFVPVTREMLGGQNPC